MFKESFKYFKRKSPVPDFSSVIDLNSPHNSAELIPIDLNNAVYVKGPFLGLEPVNTWRCYTLASTGIIIIKNPFTAEGQRYWISRCLQDYPRTPNINNLSPQLFSKEVLDDWWRSLHKCNEQNEVRRMSISMRWATLGYHHDWNSKEYTEKMRGDFPQDLISLSSFLASVLGFESYEAQAAIVNFYPIGTTLSAHTDHSEPNSTAPLFSISFGQTAIFLIGGKSKEEKPLAFYLRSGDVLVMSGISRLCYHAVPRVLKAREQPWNALIPCMQSKTSLDIPSCKRPRLDANPLQRTNAHGMDTILYNQVVDETFWLPFKSYLSYARININVRQVLNAGETRLPMMEQVSETDMEDIDATMLSNSVE
ncbi:nucleic acid dioxygenase ALKBH1-like [Eurosta solidaginis]|uniref:nucleic acid dioxygenase ALKBH1-like n=1 Tax=Eurosta solidaginis TaxID=178769 RepID=UPI003530CA9C